MCPIKNNNFVKAKTLVIIDSKKSELFRLRFSHCWDFSKLIRLIRRLEKTKNQVKVLALSIDARTKLKMEGIPFKTPADYFTQQIYESDKHASLMAKNWFRSGELNVTYEDFHLGELVEFHFYLFLVEVMKSIELMKLVLDKEKPDEIVVMKSSTKTDRLMLRPNDHLYGLAASLLATSRKIPVKEIKPSLLSRMEDYALLTFMKQLRSCKRKLTLLITHFEEVFQKGIASKKSFKKTPMNVRKILVIGRGPQLIYLVPVIKELKRRKKNVIILGLNLNSKQKKVLQRERIFHQTFDDYSTRKLRKKTSQAAVILKKKWHNLLNQRKIKDTFSYRRIPLWSFLKPRFSYLFLTRFVEIVELIETTKHIINSEEIDLILVTADTDVLEKTVVSVGNTMNVPTLRVEHGEVLIPEGGSTISALPSSNKIAVWGKNAKDWYVRNGIDSDRLFITGPPRFDNLFHWKGNKERICKELGLDGGRPIVVFTTEEIIGTRSFLYPLDGEELLRCMFNVIRESPRVQIVIKPKRTIAEGDPILIEQIATEMNVRARTRITWNVNLHQLLYACDVLVANSSTTVALEAIILNKPVITINLTGKPDPGPYAENGAAIGIHGAKDLAPAIKKILENHEVINKLQRNIERFLSETYRIDGRASQRVADLVEKIIQESMLKAKT